jgi:hypothetical protein
VGRFWSCHGSAAEVKSSRADWVRCGASFDRLRLASALAGQCDAVGVVHQPIEDGVDGARRAYSEGRGTEAAPACPARQISPMPTPAGRRACRIGLAHTCGCSGLRFGAASVDPGQLKSGVNKSSFYDPEINRSYGKMAAHYNVGVVPARPRKPKDKAKVDMSNPTGRC